MARTTAAQVHHAHAGMRVGERLRAAPDLGEEVALVEVQVELIESRHGGLPREF
jgi:hypothetical protein